MKTYFNYLCLKFTGMEEQDYNKIGFKNGLIDKYRKMGIDVKDFPTFSASKDTIISSGPSQSYMGAQAKLNKNLMKAGISPDKVTGGTFLMKETEGGIDFQQQVSKSKIGSFGPNLPRR